MAKISMSDVAFYKERKVTDADIVKRYACFNEKESDWFWYGLGKYEWLCFL